MLCVAFLLHVTAQLTNLLFVVVHFCHVYKGIVRGICICVEQIQHQLQRITVQVHVEAVLA